MTGANWAELAQRGSDVEVSTQQNVRDYFLNNNNNLLLGSSITKSGLHRGPNAWYILYNDTIKIYKLELKPKYINNYNIYTTRIKKINK